MKRGRMHGGKGVPKGGTGSDREELQPLRRGHNLCADHSGAGHAVRRPGHAVPPGPRRAGEHHDPGRAAGARALAARRDGGRSGLPPPLGQLPGEGADRYQQAYEAVREIMSSTAVTRSRKLQKIAMVIDAAESGMKKFEKQGSTR